MLLRIVSLSMRVFALFAKLGLLFYLAKYMTPEDFVLFGILTVTVAYLQYIIGLDLYNYANRQLALNRSKFNLLRIVGKQYSFYFCMYLCLLFISLILWFIRITFNEILPEWAFIFIFILITEHFFNEVYRLFNFMLQPIFAAFLYFMKSVVLFVLVFIKGYGTGHGIGIEFVLYAWLLVNTLIVLFSNLKFNLLYITLRLWCVDFNWLKVAVRFSFPLVLSALCSRAVFTFDRTLAGLYLDIDSAATYVLFMSIFFALNSVIDSVFFVFKVPRLISSFEVNFKEEFFKFKKTAMILLAIGAVSFIPGFYISQFIFSEKVGSDTQVAFFMLGFVFLLFNISQVFHFALYSYGAAKSILYTQFYALLISITVFTLGLEFQSLHTIEFFVLCVGVYCLFVCILKRSAYLQLSKANQDDKR